MNARQYTGFLQISLLFFNLSHCITLMQGRHVCYNMTMQEEAILTVVETLRKRLASTAHAELLIDTLEGQHPEARKAAVLIGFFEQNEAAYIVFIRRAGTLRSHSGEIAFPGGGMEAIDASPVATALREAQEEIGLNPGQVEVLGVLSPVFTVVSGYVITPVVAFLPHGLEQPRLQTSEVTELILVPLHGLTNPAIAHTEVWTRDGIARTIYFYDYGPYRIWGATARMLHALLDLLGSNESSTG